MQPSPLWAEKVKLQGWVSADDYLKPRGQATSVKATSYMAPISSTPPLPSSSLLDLVLRSTNEMRLQELYELYHRRKLIGPGPGEHDVVRTTWLPSQPLHVMQMYFLGAKTARLAVRV